MRTRTELLKAFALLDEKVIYTHEDFTPNFAFKEGELKIAQGMLADLVAFKSGIYVGGCMFAPHTGTLNSFPSGKTGIVGFSCYKIISLALFDGLRSINVELSEGRLLMAAIAWITSISVEGVTGNDVLRQVVNIADILYPEKKNQRDELSKVINSWQ